MAWALAAGDDICYLAARGGGYHVIDLLTRSTRLKLTRIRDMECQGIIDPISDRLFVAAGRRWNGDHFAS